MATGFSFSSALNELEQQSTPFSFTEELKKVVVPATPAPSISELSDEEYLQRVGRIKEKPLQPIGGRTTKPIEGKIAYSDLYTNDANFFKVLDYGKARFGKEGELKENESREDYVNRWASHMRRATGGNLLDGTAELQYLNNADKTSLLKAGEAYDLFEKTTGFLSASGQKGFKPVLDYISAAATSPETALSLGVGKLASTAFTKAVAEKGLQAAIKSRFATLAAVPAVEAIGGGVGGAIQEKIELNVTKAQLDVAKKNFEALSPEMQAEVKPQLDAMEKRLKDGVRASVVFSSAVASALFGTAEVVGMVKASKAVAGKSTQLEDVLKPYKKPSEPSPPVVTVKKEDPTEKALEDAYDIFEGRKLLDKEGKPTSVAEMQIRNDVNKKAAEIAAGIWQRLPDLAPQQGQKMSEAVKNVFMSLETIDDVVLRDALAAADVTPEEFARMNRTTAGDAGRTLQAYSVLARIQNKLKSIDPAAAKEVDLMYGGRNTLTTAFTGLRDISMRVDRELKALMVSQLSTTIRNAFSGAAVVTFGTASEALESALYRVGKTAAELALGTPVTGSFTGGLKGVYDDAVRTAFYLGNTDLSSQTAEMLLAGSPTLKNRILRTVGEEGDNNLSKVARIANTFNVAQDAFFRQAIFTSSVEKQLNRVGLNMYELLANNKTIPFDVLRNATDEALAATFSKMPTKGPAFHAIKFIEELGPIGSTVIPFPRFMANAMSWTYKHSPMGILSGSADVAKGATLLSKGSEEGQRYIMEGLENVSKGAIGTAAIYAAYKYREQHQDTDWYDIKNPDGSSVDARALFPLSPFLAVGDYLVKFNKKRTDEFKTKELLEALTGFKAPAGTYSWLGDKFSEAMSNAQTGEAVADKKVAQFFGEWVGEYLGRAFVPVQQLSDIIGSIDRNETLPRDAYQVEPGEEGFVTSAKQQLMKRIPELKQKLPVSQPALREEAVFNDAGPLKMLSGIALKGNPSPLEEEVTKLKVGYNKIFTTTGDKIVDANAKKVMAPLSIQLFSSIKEQPFYAESSQDTQKIILQNLLQFTQKTAKEIAVSTDEAIAFNEGRQPRLFEIKYSALPPEVKRATAEEYKKVTGKDLIETKDYMSALAFAAALRKIPGFAFGGFVGKALGSSLKTGARKSSAELLQEMQQASAVKAAGVKAAAAPPAVAPSIPTPPAVKPAETALPSPPLKKPLIEEGETVFRAESDEVPWWEYTPPPSAKLNIEDIPSSIKTVETTPESFVKTWDTNKSDKEFLEAWNKALSTATDEEFVKAFNANTIQKYKDYNKMLSTLEEEGVDIYDPEGYLKPEYEYKGYKTFSNKEDIVNFISEDNENKVFKTLKEMSDEYKVKEKSPIQNNFNETEDPYFYPKAIRGDLSKDPQLDPSTFGAKKRNAAIQTIKDTRMAAHDEVMANPRFEEFNSKVIGVALGDWRFKTGVELNPLDEDTMKSFYNFTKKYQEKYDELEKKYADRPPIVLWHGRGSQETVNRIMKEGMPNPVYTNRIQQELYVGGPSFTKDLNLTFEKDYWGGFDPRKYVYTEIPYVDYMFSKVDMPMKAYETANMNVIARTITGTPNLIRPLSLPRTVRFAETEDVIIEPEKLVRGAKYGELPLNIGGEKLKSLVERKTKVGPDFANEQKEITVGPKQILAAYEANRKDLTNIISDISTKADDGNVGNTKRKESVLAYRGYETVKNLMKTLREAATFTSIGGGMGQVYYSKLLSVAKQLTDNENNLNVIIKALDKAGASEKAYKLSRLQQQFNKLNETTSLRAVNPVEKTIKEENKAVEKIQQLTPELRAGGLVARR